MAYLETLVGQLQNRLKLFSSPLLRTYNNKHANVQLTKVMLFNLAPSIQVRQNRIVDQQGRPRLAMLESGDECAKDTDTIAVVPIVYALSNEICAGAVDWLLIEEVVLHECHSALQVVCLQLLRPREHIFGNVLHDEV